MKPDETSRALVLARRLALRAGALLHRRRGGRRTVSSKGGVGNIVTEMDHASERLILGGIRREFPGHAIVAEESGASGQAECRWHVDPLDGTVNYAHGFPLWSVSIGFEVAGRLEAGVVCCPGLGDLYEARRGRGARRNGRRRPRPRSSSAPGGRCASSAPPRSGWPGSSPPTISCACPTSGLASGRSRCCGRRPSAWAGTARW